MEVAWDFLVSILIASYQTNCLGVLIVPLDGVVVLVDLDDLHDVLHNKGSIVVVKAIVRVLEVVVDCSISHVPRHRGGS